LPSITQRKAPADVPRLLQLVEHRHRVVLRRDVAQGRLVRLLPDWTLPGVGTYAVFPASRHVPAKVRALIDFLRQAA